MTGLVEVVLMAGAMLAGAAWLFVVLVRPGRRSATTISSTRRLVVARAWLYAPLWVPAALLVAALVPSVFGADHCLSLDAHHHHLCLVHPPVPTAHLATWVLPLGVALPALIVVVRFAGRVWSEQSLARTLIATSRASGLGADVRLLDRAEPLALTVGWRSPSILLSTGLLRGVSTATRDVVLAHERAHVMRRDGRSALLDTFAASLLPRRVAAPLMAEITLAREQACDRVAAQRVGGPVGVAKALLEVVRLDLAVPATGLSVGAGALEARVAYLLRPPQHGSRWLLTPIALLLALLAAGAGPVHTAIEHLVTLLIH